MSTSHEQYIERVAEAGLLREYKEVVSVTEEGVALEVQHPDQAAQKFLKALKMTEDAGAVAGATNHPLFSTRATLISFLGDLSGRGVTW